MMKPTVVFSIALALVSSGSKAAPADVPRLQPFSFPPTVKPGSRVLVACTTTSGGSQVTLSWLKDGKDIGSAKNVFVETKRGASMIIVEPVEISNAGNYTCIAKNRAGFDSFTATLDVQAPPSWKKRPEDLRVNIGERAVIYCLATGSPTPKIKWKRQRKPNEKGVEARWEDIKFSNLVRPHENGTLVLEEVSTADEGQYTCEADNGMAPSATLTLSVTVNVLHHKKKKSKDFFFRITCVVKALIHNTLY
ncbi:Down syndrome cell adhesion molecule-like protein 1 [Ixodes scapularis]|uniref:Down syndrome cell adhesion molecule-like protein 1 n=1 Tax=Ixodes scapularis TaxID=6945 RepID=UPI001C381CEE|nr:Down syndrome cell adhesion molecule-like protein 1 [Ixodes scapularis]